MEFIASGPAVWLWSSVALFLVWWVAGRLGALALNITGTKPSSISESEWRLFSLGVGIIVIALGILAVGLAGLLTRAYVAALLIGFAFLPTVFVRHENGFSIYGNPRPAGASKNIFLCAVIALPLILSWVQALMPATGTDALAYHLFHPAEFVRNHKVFHMPFEMNRESLWPYQTEMLFTLGLLFQGTSLAQLFHWSFYPLTAAAVYLLAKRFYGLRPAFLASVVFLYTPAVFAQSGEAYVDLSLAFFVLMAVYLILLWQNNGRTSFLILSGLFCGGVIGTKLLGLGALLILTAFVLQRSKFSWKPVLIFVSACLLAGGVWYFRSWWVTGNPVYPFFSQFFPGRGVWSIPLRMLDVAGMSQGEHFDIGVVWRDKQGFLDFVLLLWRMTLFPGLFGGEILGPLFLMFLPFFALTMKKPSRPSMYLLIFTVAYTYFIFSQSQYTRFFLSCATFWSVAVAIALDRILSERSVVLRRVALGVFLLALCLHAGLFFYRGRDHWGVFLGKNDAAAYLAGHERSFKAHTYLKEHVKPGEKLFVSSEVTYFYNGVKGTVWDNIFLRNLLRQKRLSVLDHLRAERFDYIWLAYYEDKESVEKAELIMDFVKSSGYQLVYSYDYPERTVTYRHFIYKIRA